MKKAGPKLFEPSEEDIARMQRYRSLPTEKKLEWLEQVREFMIEVWKRNPELLKVRKKFG